MQISYISHICDIENTQPNNLIRIPHATMIFGLSNISEVYLGDDQLIILHILANNNLRSKFWMIHI